MKGSSTFVLALAAAALPAPVAAQNINDRVTALESAVARLSTRISDLEKAVASPTAQKPAVLEVNLTSMGNADPQTLGAYTNKNRNGPGLLACSTLGYDGVLIAEVITTANAGLATERGYVTRVYCTNPKP